MPSASQQQEIPHRRFGRHDDLKSIIGLGGYHHGMVETASLRDEALDGRFELYKTTAEHEGDVGRSQHGFPLQDEVAQ